MADQIDSSQPQDRIVSSGIDGMFQVNRITIRCPTWSGFVFGIAVFVLLTATPVFGQKTADDSASDEIRAAVPKTSGGFFC